MKRIMIAIVLGSLLDLAMGAIQYPKTQDVQDFSEVNHNKASIDNLDRDRLKVRTSQLESNGVPKLNNNNTHESSNTKE